MTKIMKSSPTKVIKARTKSPGDCKKMTANMTSKTKAMAKKNFPKSEIIVESLFSSSLFFWNNESYEGGSPIRSFTSSYDVGGWPLSVET